MRSTHTFSILFWADQKNAINGEVLIYARITVDKKRANISLKRRVPQNLWDPKKKKLRGNSHQAQSANQYLDQIYTQLFQIYQDLKLKESLLRLNLLKHNTQVKLTTKEKHLKIFLSTTVKKSQIHLLLAP